MSEREPNVSRWRHYRAALARQARGRGKDTIAIVLLSLVAIVMTLYIFSQQKASIPSWTPFVGQEYVDISADFSNAQAVRPGAGQGIYIAGIQIGKVSSVELEEGHARVGMEVEPKYLDIIRPDATLLLRPKTGLNDMTVEIDPGVSSGHIEEGHNFPLSRTEPTIQLESTLAVLDADTRQYLQLLVAGGAQGIGGRGRQVSNALRRFQPFTHYVSELNQAVAGRRDALAQVIHDFSLLTTELGKRDAQIERFVSASQEALGNFANQQAALQESLVEFPPTLNALRSASASANQFSLVARPALLGLIPQSQALGPALEATERLFDQTLTPISDQIRPFTREVRPVVNQVRRGAPDLNRTVRGFGNVLDSLNSFLNELAFNPEGTKESNLFYLSWLNHNLNANFNLTDAGGPILRSLPLITCNLSWLADSFAPSRPQLETFLQASRLPAPDELPPIPEDKRNPGVSCGPE